MKKSILKISFSLVALISGTSVFSQCPTITCQNDTVLNNDASTCGAIVNYVTPVGTNPCPDTTVTFSYTGTIDTWTVPTGVTSVRIEAKGAEGGNNNVSSNAPGLGAIMIGDFNVTPGSTLNILVGEQPATTNGNGGGGGTFVTDASNNPLIVAGGGGGSSATTDSPDKHGNITTTGGTGAAGGGTGGTAGSGGNIGASGFQSGAGGGLLTNGANGWTTNTGGLAFVNGGSGGTANGNARGGFGGGGSGSSNVVGGGGGGYSGGGSGGNSSGGVGGGGASFNGGTNQNNTGGANSGHGEVIISWGSTPISTTQIAGLASGSTFPIGITTNTFVTTAGSVSDTCSFTVTVNDTEAPVISCPSNVVSCVQTVNNIAPTTSDNCPGETVTFTLTGATTGTGSTDASGTTFNQGITTVKYIVSDSSGNQDSCSFNVEVLAPLTGSVTSTICNNDSIIVNGTTYNTSNPSGTEVFTNVGPNNCDSTVTISLNVLPALTGSVTSTICNDESVIVNGTTYNASNPSGTEVFSNVGPNNCDSTVTINLNVLAAIDVTVANNSPSLTSNENGASYQWLDCDNSFSAIAGATGQTFNATNNGNYAVAVTVGNCVDTSACESVNNVGINEYDLFNGVSIFPNPTNNIININLNAIDNVNLTVYTIDGKVVYQNNNINEEQTTIDLSKNSKGIYFLKVEAKNQNKVYKVIKE